MQHELKQVEVRLRLTDKTGVFSMERIDTPDKAVSVLAPVLAELDREEVCVVPSILMWSVSGVSMLLW